MAVPSNRSPSPLSSRRISQSRNLDSNSATRRSFSGIHFPRPSIVSNPRNFNPVTPANSPAGFGRKNSVGNLLGCDDKENEKDQTLKVVEAARSPANGSKNFMAPTISAASKFTPSPRKKILVERNDPVRTSISLSEGKATFFSAISSEIVEDLDQQNDEGSMESTVGNLDQKDDDLDLPRISKSSKRVTFLEGPPDSEVKSGLKPEIVAFPSHDRCSVDLGSKNTPSLPVSPIIAPLDADPSLPPYDPKTNFLSPRPQFLHYKPNPRIEVLLSKEKVLELGKGKNIQDNFMLEVSSENFSDTDGTEESSSEDCQKDSAENVLPEGTGEELYVSESTNTLSHVMAEGIVEGTVGENPESSPISHGISEGNFEQETEEKTIGELFSQEVQDMSKDVLYDTGKPKPSILRILKSVSLLLILAAACVSFCVTICPSMDTSVLDTLKPPKLPDRSEIGLLTKANLNQLGARFKRLSYDSISHLSLLVNKLGRGDNFGHVLFINLTFLEDEAVCNSFDDLQQSLAQIKDLEEKDVEEEEEWEAAFSDEPTYPKMVSDDSNERELEDASELGAEELVSAPVKLAEISKSQSSESLRDMEEASSRVVNELKSQEDSEDDLALLSIAPVVIFPEKVDPEVINTDDFDLDMGRDSVAKVVESSSADMDTESTLGTLHSIVADSSSEMGAEELVSAPAKLAEISKSQSSESLRDMEEASSRVVNELKIQEDSEDDLALLSIAPVVIFPEKVDPEVINTDDFDLDMGRDSVAKVVESSSSADMDTESTLDTLHSIVADSSSEMLEAPTDGSEDKDPSAYSIWRIASLVSALVSSAAFIYWKQSKSSNPNSMVHTADGLSGVSMNPVSAVPEKIFQSKPAYQNCAAEVDVTEESCSSDMSSFQRSSSYCRKDSRVANEVQSQDRTARNLSKRESLASSSEFSTGSPSYGSFTTYERISSKHANGDDEIMTPVRRSSRIRNQVISP